MEHATFWKEFFQMYRDLPALWRIKSTEYTDRALKTKCYLKLIRKLKEIYPAADREMVVRKINNFRTSYRKELKRMIDCKETGKAYKPTLWYFDNLRFLDDHDEGCWGEKFTNEIENEEEKKEGSRNVIIDSQVTNEAVGNKRCGNFKESEKEYLPNPSQRRKVKHNLHKSSTKKRSFAEQQEAKHDAEILAKSWAVQYKDMKKHQKLIARKLISDILFYGSLGTLNVNHAIGLQEIFVNETTNPWQHSNSRSPSPIESNSSFHLAQQDVFNATPGRESTIELNINTSPCISPTMNYLTEMQVNDIKVEIP